MEVGVPFKQGIGFLEDMHVGDSVGFNKKILTPESLFTFAAPYVFFPYKDNHKFFDGDGKLDVDLYNADDWILNKFGIFANRGATVAEMKHLRHVLDRARLFRSKIIAREMQYPPIASLMSDLHPTIHKVLKNGPHSVRGWDFASMDKTDGDGRVSMEGSLPPQGIPYEQYKTPLTHGDLLNDPSIPRILEFLLVQQQTMESRL
eukprot:TRINITY_DN1480_c0_g1_i2.p1 TRINITY_DN1480_c0_g1~~TRINITY_DN1480_c0_g1_i2.p1  ORF type:complete len:204 (-),score=39.64 TRINITY_DN1480_c0_g1_i2:52-663(-)